MAAALVPRYLQGQVEADLARKMVFLGGPRQVGKTSLGRAVITDPRAYLNYDVAEHRDALLRGMLPPTDAWLFDEIHKYRGWRNFLKGLYDARRPGQRILVSGSARLDAMSARFENLVAAHLLKWVEYQIDTQGRALELRYFRDIDGREVDFVLTERGGKPLGFVECKWEDGPVDPSLRYLKQRFPNVPAWQVSAVGSHDYVTPEGIRVAPTAVLLGDLV